MADTTLTSNERLVTLISFAEACSKPWIAVDVVAALKELQERRVADAQTAELRRDLANARELIANAIGGTHETEALPLANLPPGAEERLANAISTSIRLETLSNQALVDIALDGCFEESPTATVVLHEMCSRLHPEWENEDPEGNSPSKNASEGQS
jgi:hypothetical protein